MILNVVIPEMVKGQEIVDVPLMVTVVPEVALAIVKVGDPEIVVLSAIVKVLQLPDEDRTGSKATVLVLTTVPILEIVTVDADVGTDPVLQFDPKFQLLDCPNQELACAFKFVVPQQIKIVVKIV